MFDLIYRKFGRMVTGTFRSNVWDPVLIIGQIICMQCQFVLTLGLWVYVLNFILGYDTEIGQLFKQAVSTLSPTLLSLLISFYFVWIKLPFDVTFARFPSIFLHIFLRLLTHTQYK